MVRSGSVRSFPLSGVSRVRRPAIILGAMLVLVSSCRAPSSQGLRILKCPRSTCRLPPSRARTRGRSAPPWSMKGTPLPTRADLRTGTAATESSTPAMCSSEPAPSPRWLRGQPPLMFGRTPTPLRIRGQLRHAPYLRGSRRGLVSVRTRQSQQYEGRGGRGRLRADRHRHLPAEAQRDLRQYLPVALRLLRRSDRGDRAAMWNGDVSPFTVDAPPVALAEDDNGNSTFFGCARIDYTEGLAPGTYYVRVRGQKSTSAGVYAVRLLRPRSAMTSRGMAAGTSLPPATTPCSSPTMIRRLEVFRRIRFHRHWREAESRPYDDN